MEKFEFYYLCDDCGECCKHFNPAQHDIDLVDEDGVCKYLDKKTNLCTIYETRPYFCRTKEYYEKDIKSTGISFEYYLHTQRLGCDMLRKLGNKGES